MTDERRPPFAAAFPRDEELDRLVEAFERGNFALVRASAPPLIASSEDEAVRRAARELLDRTKPDPLAVGLVALTAALLVAVAAYWVINAKPPAASSPRPPAPKHSSVVNPSRVGALA
jgi:hypothetical protein